MTDSEIHSILFRGVIARLSNARGQNDQYISDGRDELPAQFHLAFQERPEDFRHNYERDKFLHHRDRYIMTQVRGQGGDLMQILVKLSGRENVTVYKKPLENIFGRDTERAFETLKKLLHKFYDVVESDDLSGIRRADYSSNRNSNHIRIINEV